MSLLPYDCGGGRVDDGNEIQQMMGHFISMSCYFDDGHKHLTTFIRFFRCNFDSFSFLSHVFVWHFLFVVTHRCVHNSTDYRFNNIRQTEHGKCWAIDRASERASTSSKYNLNHSNKKINLCHQKHLLTIGTHTHTHTQPAKWSIKTDMTEKKWMQTQTHTGDRINVNEIK